MKPYIADAAGAGKVGKLDLSRGEFFYDLILISYFDGRQWRSASIWNYRPEKLGDKAEFTRLFRLTDVLYYGLGIEGTGFGPDRDDDPMRETVTALKALRGVKTPELLPR